MSCWACWRPRTGSPRPRAEVLRERLRQRTRDLESSCPDQAEGRGTEHVGKKGARTRGGRAGLLGEHSASMELIRGPWVSGGCQGRVRESAIRDRLISGLDLCWTVRMASEAGGPTWPTIARGGGACARRRCGTTGRAASGHGGRRRGPQSQCLPASWKVFARVWINEMNQKWTPTVERLLLAAQQRAPDNFHLNEYLCYGFMALERQAAGPGTGGPVRPGGGHSSAREFANVARARLRPIRAQATCRTRRSRSEGHRT